MERVLFDVKRTEISKLISEEFMMSKKTKIIIGTAVIACCAALCVFCGIFFNSYDCVFYTNDGIFEKYVADVCDLPQSSVEILQVDSNGKNVYVLYRTNDKDSGVGKQNNIGLVSLEKVGAVPKLFKLGIRSYRSKSSVSSAKYSDPKTSSVVIFGDNTVYEKPDERACSYTVYYGDKRIVGDISTDYFIIPCTTADAGGASLRVEVLDANGNRLYY